MVMHQVFGVERDIDLPKSSFQAGNDIIKEEEKTMPGCEHGWLESCLHEDSKKKVHLHYRKFVPQGQQKPRAIVTFLHGLGAHSGIATILPDGRKFNASLQSHRYVQEEGWAFYALDMHGHGYSEGDRNYWPHREVLVEDYMNFIRLVASFHEPGTPIFLTGLSFGSALTLLVAKYIREHPDIMNCHNIRLDSILLLAPAFFAPFQYHLFMKPTKLWLQYMVTPWFPRFEFENYLVDKQTQLEQLYRDPELLQAHVQDKLRRFDGKMDIYSVYHVLEAIETITEYILSSPPPPRGNGKYHHNSLLPPMCIICGEKDPICPVNGSEFLYQMVGVRRKQDKELHVIPDAVHALLGDPAADQVMDIMIQWIRTRLENSSSLMEEEQEDSDAEESHVDIINGAFVEKKSAASSNLAEKPGCKMLVPIVFVCSFVIRLVKVLLLLLMGKRKETKLKLSQ